MNPTNQNLSKPSPPGKYEQFMAGATNLVGWGLTGVSAATSVLGAQVLVSANKWVAASLAIGLNLMLFGAAHAPALRPLPAGFKYMRWPRLIVWVVCLCFSVALSFFGFFELYRQQVATEGQQRVAQQNILAATSQLNQFKSEVTAALNEKVTPMAAQLAAENKRVNYAQQRGWTFSAKKRDQLKAQKEQLDAALKAITELQVFDSAQLNGDLASVRRALFEAFQRAAAAHALLPQELQEKHRLPVRAAEEEVAAALQVLAWQQLMKRDPVTCFLLFVALVIDLVPTLSVLRQTPVRSVARLIRDGRWWCIEFWRACFGKLATGDSTLRMVAENYPLIETQFVLNDSLDKFYGMDLQPHFALIEAEVSKAEGRPMRIASLTTTSGMELLPDLVLSEQLDADRTIHLRFEPAPVEVKQ